MFNGEISLNKSRMETKKFIINTMKKREEEERPEKGRKKEERRRRRIDYEDAMLQQLEL